ncbi:general secretion pathway protein GspD [Rhodopirellula sp. MGV]|nr:general secretion pathway protein GspD [Rhodopirellula sp. MGV]PNY35553.1 general secretion pathway protein GspD [Rhodopirellula baltica]
MPGANLPSKDNSGAATTAVPSYARGAVAPAANVQNGKALVGQARAALDAKQFESAVEFYRSAQAAASVDPKIASDVARLRVDLQIAGIDAALLNLPPRMAAGFQAQPMPTAQQNVAATKAEALRLVAQGRLALDRGDTAGALGFARQAQQLNIPESAFAPGEPRVWDFVLDAESAAKRTGVMDSQIALAGGAGGMDSDEANFIQQMLFSGETGGAVQQVQALGAPLPQGNAADPVADYEAGLQALQAGDQDTARQHFIEAWKYESQLDLATRNALKDKLTLLQPKRLPTAAEKAEMTAIERVDLETKELTQRLYREITAELAKTAEMKESAPLDALDSLNRLRRRVDGSNVPEANKTALVRMVDRELEKQKQYVENNRAAIELNLQNEAVRTEMANEAAREVRIDEEISSLVDTFNELVRDQRFEEAEVVAKQVSELKPGSTVATNMLLKSRFASRDQMMRNIQSGKEELFQNGLMDVELSASQVAGYDPNQPMTFNRDPQSWHELSIRRSQDTGSLFGSVQERKLKEQLSSTRVNIQYRNRPLREVIDDLSNVTGIPMVLNRRALEAVNVLEDTPVTLELRDQIVLKSALNLILQDFDLAYEIKDEVLQITSSRAKRENVVTRTYKVADLVTPIPNFVSSHDDGLAGALRAAYQMTNPRLDVQMMPVSMTDLATRQANTMNPAKMSSNVLGQYSPMGSQGGFGPQNPPGGAGGGSFADFDSLIQLIQTTVVPDTWEALGGNSTMAPYRQNLSLIVSTTSDVHDQIVDLIESLRSLQNLQITIEVRFITLSDTFFEQIGVDFDVQFDDNVTNLPSDDEGPSVTVGFDGVSGLPRADLDVRLDNTLGVNPIFGAPDPGSLSTLGFAILSDIEAFFFLQAAQGDERTNVMQAPKVTLFDGQIASISDQSQRPFVTSITPVVGDFAVAQQPVIVVLNEGTQLNVQGIVSDDKRFVRLTLVPFFSQIGDVDTFTFEGSRTTRSSSTDQEDTNGDGVVDENDAVDSSETEDVITGTTVQLPTFAFTTVSTTVSVPDGGTILLGGIKRLSEGRSERGVPILSKIPYLSRLFRNVAVGRDATSLMLMVTPRIIIQEEEEFAQTGYQTNR